MKWPLVWRRTYDRMVKERDECWTYASNPTALDRQLANANIMLSRSNRSLRGVVTKQREKLNELRAEIAALKQEAKK